MKEFDGWSEMTTNYPHEGSVEPKANALIGGLISSCEIASLPDGKLCRGGQIPHVCQKKKNLMARLVLEPILLQSIHITGNKTTITYSGHNSVIPTERNKRQTTLVSQNSLTLFQFQISFFF